MRLFSSLVLSILFMLCYTRLSYAADDILGSTYTQITITNQTTTTCKLLSDQLLSGNLVSTPPHTIAPNQDETFALSQQTFYGPTLSLAYLCGNAYIAFEIQQDSAVMIGHTPTVSTLQNDGVIIIATAKPSSCWFNNPATVHLLFVPHNSLLQDLGLTPAGSRLKANAL